jgi:hypothetical protein
MSRAIAEYVAQTKRQIEQLPVGETRAKLEIRFARAATDLARRISTAAKAKGR